RLNTFCILNCSIDFESIADDASIGKQASAIFFAIFRNLINIEVVIRLAKILRLLQDRDPRKSCLIDFKNKSFKEQVVILERESVLCIVIRFVEGVFGVRAAVLAISGHDSSTCFLNSDLISGGNSFQGRSSNAACNPQNILSGTFSG